MDVPANPASTRFILNQSFSVRLAEAKKAAIEAALKCRHDCLRATDLKHRQASNTERVLNAERVSNIEAVSTTEPVSTTEDVPNTEAVASGESVSGIQILKNHSNAIDQSTNVTNDSQFSLNARTPFKSTKPYSQLKSARKRKLPTSIKKTDTRFSPSTAKSTMESSSQTVSHPVSA